MDKEISTKKSVSKESQKTALHYMKTLVDVARESFLILDSKLMIISANPVFYQNFHVTSEQTENKFIYDLGNGQWSVRELKKLLEDILPNQKIIKDYEVEHDFPTIGKKIMQLNAKQIDSMQLIVLAVEDVTEKIELKNKITQHAKDLEIVVVQRTSELASRLKEVERLNKSMVGRELKMVELKKEIVDLKQLVKNGNGNNNSRK